jgi:ribosomal protein S14
LCSKCFHCKALIARHMAESHLQSKEKNVCNICGKSYALLQSLRVHRIKAHHKKKL